MNCPSCGIENPAGTRFCMSCDTRLDLSEEPATSSPKETATSEGFVGREREMDALGAALQEVLSGHGQLVLLVGEPGIGKTRTAQEFARAAASQSFQVHWGRCYEEEGTPPYWPWVQILRSYLQQTDCEQVATDMGPGAADIAEIVSEVRTKLPDLESPPTLAPEQARFRLFDSIVNFLNKLAYSQPLMLVLDDLHWADKPSLLLLQFLARQMRESRLLIVGSYRDVELSRQHPLSETLAQLTREPVFRRELLRGLSQEDTERFVASTAGIEPSRGLVKTIYTQTEGNPFFMSEVLRLLSEQGELTTAGFDGPQGIRIPEGVREVIGQRLNRLSEQCNQALTIGAVIGREFDFRLLSTLFDEINEDQLLEVIDEALNARLIEAMSGSGEHYQFSHALVQQTLIEELSPSRQVRLHARIGEALEDFYGADIRSHSPELAHHFHRAAPVLGSEKLVRYSFLAGEQALATYAHEEAMGHFERALAVKEGQPLDAETAALWFGLGQAQVASLPRQEIHRAFFNLIRAFDYYEGIGETARAVAIAEYPTPPWPGLTSGVGQLIARALDLVLSDSLEAGRLLSRYGRVLAEEEGDDQGAREALSRALSIAKQENDIPLEMRTLANSAQVDYQYLRLESCLEKSLQAIELVHRVDDLRTELAARHMCVLSLTRLGDLDNLRRHAAAMLDPAERLRDRYWLATAYWSNDLLYSLQGDWSTARDFSNRGLAVVATDPRLLHTRVLLEYQSGNFEEGETYLDRLAEAVQPTSFGPNSESSRLVNARGWVACITGATHQLDLAATVVGPALPLSDAFPGRLLPVTESLAMLAVQQGNQTAAREHYATLLPYQGIITLIGGSAIDQTLGLLAQTMGQLDQAMAHFEEARSLAQKANYRPALAWTCLYYASAALQRNGPGDHAKARALMEEALIISQELEMRPLTDRLVALGERAELQPASSPAYPGGLTQREVEVLRLIATGRTDREIAGELFISVKTVGNHVSNILNKTSGANRTEAATYAAQHGLL
ncbi:MAG: AAA family ATPase [Dehalococcoidia bacterium]